MKEQKSRKSLFITDGELKEDFQREVRYQLYLDCYSHALGNIMEDVLRKLNIETAEDEEVYSGDVNNIISFIGDRGTGKTTALREFCRLLSRFRENEKNSWIEKMPLDDRDKNRLLQQEVNFVVLPSIDASLLEEKEDLFELILAGMYEKCEEYWRTGSYSYGNAYSEERQQVLKKLGEVYRTHRSVKVGDRQEDLGESVVTRLRTMASSRKIQEAFGDLIKNFFRQIKDERAKINYLVIVIDDLDLNLAHGFQMLEEMQKYLTHPDVIILTALSYKQLSIITESHFIKNLGFFSEGGNVTEEVQLHCKELATDYLDKLIPVSNRIYMPDISAKSKNIEIGETGEKRTMQAKKYVMWKNAEKMHIYYDGLGLKKHFIEKRTVRTLLSSVQFLDSLTTVDFSESTMFKGEFISGGSDYYKENIRKMQHELVRVYERNYERYNADIRERMVFEKTDDRQRRFFDDLIGTELGRRGRYVAALNRDEFSKLTLNAEAVSISYRYGDLLKSIFEWGRKQRQDKPLIHCVMASFTSEMVHEYICYMYSDSEKKRAESRKKLTDFLGKSFGSVWTKNMLPVLWDTDVERVRRTGDDVWSVGFYENLELQGVGISVPLAGLQKVLNSAEGQRHEFSDLEVREAFINNIIKAVTEDFAETKLIWILECMDMLFVNARLNNQETPNLSFSFMLDSSTLQEKRLFLSVGLYTTQSDFDIFGFVQKSIAPRKENEKLVDGIAMELAGKLSRCLTGWFNEPRFLSEGDNLRKKLKRKLKKQSIFAMHERQDMIAFPFFEFDLSYNIIKRVRNKCQSTFIQPIEIDNIMVYITKIYDFIKLELQKEEEFYTDEKGDTSFLYCKIFSEYPYIKAMEKLRDNYWMNSILAITLRAGMSPYIPEPEISD